MLLPLSFYARDALEVAPELLGKIIQHGEVGLRITEVEAYCFPNDSANHCRAGKTKRNAVMWGKPGRAYVYLCYGLHHMLNVVTNQEGEGAAVLIRSCEPVTGLPEIQKRRRGIEGPAMLAGPGKVAAALALNRSHNGAVLYEEGGLQLLDAPAPAAMLRGARVGIDYATAKDQRVAWRFAAAGSAWVSHRKKLVP